jgi:hypothetical protein
LRIPVLAIRPLAERLTAWTKLMEIRLAGNLDVLAATS